MNPWPVKSSLLIILTLLGTVMVLTGLVPNFTIPTAKAAPPNNLPTMSLFNDQRHTNAVIDTSLGSGSTFVMDINLTDAGLFKSFDANVTFNPSAIQAVGSAISGAGCPKVQGCIFDGIVFTQNVNHTLTNTWDPVSPVVYDSNLNNIYDSAEAVIADLISGGTGPPVAGTPLNTDSHLRFYDTNNNNLWDSGEPVVLDRNLDGKWSSGELVIASVFWKTDPLMKFAGPGTAWVAGNTVAYDTNNNGIFDAGEPVVNGTAPVVGTALKSDPLIHYVDANNNNVWNAGELALYDGNGDGVFNTNDIPITQMTLKTDTHVKYVVLANQVRLNAVDSDSSTPYVNGNGIMFRITFRVQAANVATVIHISSNTLLQTPAVISFNPIDGYFDNRLTGATNYNVAVAPTTMTILRTVTGTNSSTTTVSLSGLTGVSGSISLAVGTGGATSLPVNAVASFNPPSCTVACSSILTITINGGSKAGATTTPSGNYSIAVLGSNAVSGIGTLYKIAWLKLVIKPPKAPVYSLSASSTSVTHELGNLTSVNVSASLASGANDTIQFASDCPIQLAGGDCVFKSNGGKFPFATQMNITTLVTSTPVGLHYIHVIPTTQGTYSETTVTMPIESVLTGTLKVDAKLKTDPKIKFLNSTNTDTWAPGKGVFYDTNSNGLYDSGEPVIAGTAPTVGTKIKNDPLIKFLNSTNIDTWTSGKPVGYDANSNGLYDVGLTIAVNVIKTHDLAVTTVSTPSRIAASVFAYSTISISGNPLNANVTVVNYGTVSETFTVNGTGKNIISIDSPLGVNRLAFYDIAHPNITQFNPLASLTSIPLKFDPKIKFVIYHTNTTWVRGEAVIYDADSSGTYTSGDIIISTDFRGLAPSIGTTLTADAKLKFYDSNGNNAWDRFSLSAESVIYDTFPLPNGDNMFESSDTAILCALGCLAPTGSWISDETIIYDANSNGIYDTGETLIKAGAQVPAPGTLLADSDTLLGFVDGFLNGAYTTGDIVAYDTNGNGVYDLGEPVPVNPTPFALSPGVLLGTQTGTIAAGSSTCQNRGTCPFVVIKVGLDPGGLTWGPALIRSTVTITTTGCASACEFYTFNNQGQSPLTVALRFPGDVNGDCKVDIQDFSAVGGEFGLLPTDARYTAAYNMFRTPTGQINVSDFSNIGGHFGHGCANP